VLSAIPTLPASSAVARQYLFGGLFWGSLAQLWMLAVVAWLSFSRRASALRRWANQRRVRALRTRAAHDARVIAGLFTLLQLLEFPFALYLSFFRERWFGFGHRTLAAWLTDWGKSYAVGLVVALLILLPALAVLRRFPRRWWLMAWALTVAVMVFGAALEPVLIEPLFNHFTPLHDQLLRTRILNLAARAGIPAHEVYEVDRSRQTGHTNAYVVGLLGTERIVLYDTLLQAETPDQIAFVMGHEMGHYVLNHIWKGLALGALGSLGFFILLAGLESHLRGHPQRGWRADFAGFTSPGALPLLLLLLMSCQILLMPVENGISRHFEHQADAYGLQLTHDPVAAMGVFAGFATHDLSDPDPPAWVEWWFFTHPSLRHRYDFARRSLLKE